MFFKDTATTEIYTLSLHDALPICISACRIVGIVVGGRVRHVVDVIKLGTADSSVNTRTGISIIHHVV